MPYNTRRKSVSLSALGIQVPSTSRAHRPSVPKSSVATETQQPPTKKVKRSHASNTSSPVSPLRQRSSTASSSTKTVSFAERPKSSGRAAYEHTPPPSPGAADDSRIDTDNVSDDIVVGVIQQLEKTGNRPHLMKELAAILSTTNDAVLNSANPSALLSSRLSAYLRRSCWTKTSPCPLEKELVPVHPRKVYYFLTTKPRQEFPTDSSDILDSPLIIALHSGGKGGKRIVSPSLSNASVDEDMESAEDRRRATLSPSPEIDLSAHELDDALLAGEDDYTTPPTPAGTFSGRSSLARDGSNASEEISLAHNHRAASPPLEGDEKEFTQTASNMRMRGMSLDDQSIRPSMEIANPDRETEHEIQVDETEEEKARRNREVAADLFGGQHDATQDISSAMLSSPMIRPIHEHVALPEVKMEETPSAEMKESNSILGDSGFGVGWDTREPENIGLDELDDLFGAF
ncbi:MAG: hypothetical protein HETSPECPRED_009568 [Heterodermia speciosa]|uniref:GDS1 winged helix domain-containing protein n=1 Tax=Heterodermia speciosa TaxID=116794 RepID=A0A8H3EQR3_9LECA|nr:MAG: hypothetical protein HETSPECPRED_009568 [Heterodermia speciosa]